VLEITLFCDAKQDLQGSHAAATLELALPLKAIASPSKSHSR
jgi:hypothetical protein